MLFLPVTSKQQQLSQQLACIVHLLCGFLVTLTKTIKITIIVKKKKKSHPRKKQLSAVRLPPPDLQSSSQQPRKLRGRSLRCRRCEPCCSAEAPPAEPARRREQPGGRGRSIAPLPARGRPLAAAPRTAPGPAAALDRRVNDGG